MAAVTSVFENTNVVYTETPSRRFQMYPLWRAFSKSSVFAVLLWTEGLTGGKKASFSNLSGLPLTRR